MDYEIEEGEEVLVFYSGLSGKYSLEIGIKGIKIQTWPFESTPNRQDDDDKPDYVG